MRIIDNTYKMQQGGAFPPFAIYNPIPQAMMGPVPTEKAGTQQNQSLLSDDQLKLLMEKGLPSDVESFYNSVNTISSGIFNNPFNPSSINQQMNMIGAMLNKIRYNSSEFDRVTKIADENGGLQEIAITNRGRLIAMNSDQELSEITPNEYSKNKDKYALLTNGDLAQMRATNQALANDTSIFTIIENGIGMKQINEMLWDTITKIGKDTSKKDGFITRNTALQEGINELLEAPEGVYKVTSESSTQNRKAQAALNYLYTTLPVNARTLLQTKAIQAGLDPTTGAYELIQSLVTSGLTDDISTSINYETSASKALSDATSGNGSSSGSTEDTSFLQMWINGQTSDISVEQINPGTNYEFLTVARRFNNFFDLENKPIDQANLAEALVKTGLNNSDKKSISIAGKFLSDSDLQDVMVDFTYGAKQMYLPYTTDSAGRTKPDFEVAKRINEALDQIEAEGPVDDSRRQQIFKEHNVAPYWNIQKLGEAAPSDKVKLFYVVTGIFQGRDLKLYDDTPGVFHLDNSVQNYYQNRGKALLQRMTDELGEDARDLYPRMTMGKASLFGSIIGGDWELYSSNIYIPVSKDPTSSLIGQQKLTNPKGTSDVHNTLNRASVVNQVGNIRTNF